MEPSDILSQLNDPQRQACRTIDGPVLVLAGAGTGKTRVITFRIAYMLAMGINPRNILGLTFTNKAAREMRERLSSLVSPEVAKHVTLGTFHAFCVRILRKEIAHLNYLPGFTIADEADQQGILKQAMSELGHAKTDISLQEALTFIGREKNALRFPSASKRLAMTDYDVVLAQVYGQYQSFLEMQNMVDFDDLLLLTHRILSEFPDVLNKYQELYHYLLIDEYQDTNDAQFAIVKLLASKRNNLCVVGDDDQSIYGWRGANIENILNFPDLFQDTTSIKLEQNYRSTNLILQAANAVISQNKNRHRKSLWSASESGENIMLVKLDNEEAEADFIAAFIQQQIGENPALHYKDFAILYRSNHLSRQLEQSLRKNHLPYKLVGGQEFFKRREIRDAAAYLKLLVNPQEDQSLLRILSVPPRGLAQKAVDKLKELQRYNFNPMSAILSSEPFLQELSSKAKKAAIDLDQTLSKYREIFQEPGALTLKAYDFLREVGYLDGLQKIYKDIDDALKRRENIDEFLNAMAQFEKRSVEPPTLNEFLESFALLEENDKTADDTDDGNAVTLSTVHASKGLEFGYVFIVAAEENIFPHERAIREQSIDEELRLFYVAITRARLRLAITFVATRMQRGREQNQRPSRFLEALPEDILTIGGSEDFIKMLSKDELNAAFENIFNLLK